MTFKDAVSRALALCSWSGLFYPSYDYTLLVSWSFSRSQLKLPMRPCQGARHSTDGTSSLGFNSGDWEPGKSPEDGIIFPAFGKSVANTAGPVSQEQNRNFRMALLTNLIYEFWFVRGEGRSRKSISTCRLSKEGLEDMLRLRTPESRTAADIFVLPSIRASGNQRDRLLR